MDYVWIGLGVGFGVLLAIVFIRALLFVPKQESIMIATPLSFNKEKSVSDLAHMIQCKTISNRNHDLENHDEFRRFQTLLDQLFPNVIRVCEKKMIGPTGLLYHWKGQSPDQPIVLMSHYDVVSVDTTQWSVDPFGGVIVNDVLYGRGTIDTKGTLNATMQAAEHLIQEGFVPQNDIYFSFSGDEEIAGASAPLIVAYLKENNIKPVLVVDEGGAIIENALPHMDKKAALIGTTEKGMMDLEFSIASTGGHASTPPSKSSIGQLAKACLAIENQPFKIRLSDPVKEMFDTLGRHSSFGYRLIFSNLWLFMPFLDMSAHKHRRELNAMLRTTVAFTQMEGSKGTNVLPNLARLVANIRLQNGDTTESVIKRLTQIIDNPHIQMRKIYGMNPCAISKTKGIGWDIIKSSIEETWNDVVVSPYLMFAATDSRHFSSISDAVYRFSALHLTPEERKLVHANDERIPITKIHKMVEFYIRMISKC